MIVIARLVVVFMISKEVTIAEKVLAEMTEAVIAASVIIIVKY